MQDYNLLVKGKVITIRGLELANIRVVGAEFKGKDRVDGKEPLQYQQFSLGGRSFTIDSNDQESMDMLRDAKKRATVGQLVLEATEFDAPELKDGQETGDTITKKSFRFISAISSADAIALTKNAGLLAKEEAAWATSTNTTSLEEITAIIDSSVTKAVAAAIPVAEA